MQNGYSRSPVSMSMKSHWGLLTHNNFGLIYEISKDIATAKNKNGNVRRHCSQLMLLYSEPQENRHNPYILTN